MKTDSDTLPGKIRHKLFFIYRNKIKKRIRYKRHRMNFGHPHIAASDKLDFSAFQSQCNFFFNPSETAKYVGYLRQWQLDQDILYQAEKVMNHRFNLLGSGETDLGTPINWHLDFRSGFTWPKQHISLIDGALFHGSYLSLQADIKVPWELSRFQYLSLLGQAYWLTGDERYPKEFRDQIEDWVEHNPLDIGVNWACTMEVAIRSANWILAFYYFKCSPCLDSNFRNKFFRTLFQAGLHIEAELEIDSRGHGNNHLLANYVGLIWLGIFFKGFHGTAARWLQLGTKGLIRELDFQFYEDGATFEGSIPYHRLVTEMALSTALLASRNEMSLPSSCLEKIERMCEFVLAYTKPDGRSPQIGDTDDGRLHQLAGYGCSDWCDHGHILTAGGEFFHRPDFKSVNLNAWSKMESVWLNGTYEEVAPITKEGHCVDLHAECYAGTGIYIYRNPDHFLLVRCGSVIQGRKGGHLHNDQLSFEIHLNGEDIFIDAGTFCYTMDKDKRQQYRKGSSHNVSNLIDRRTGLEMEQNIFRNQTVEELFEMISKQDGKCLINETRGNRTCFEGEIQIADTDILYNRRLELDSERGTLRIKDTMKGADEEKYQCIGRLHAAPGVRIFLESPTTAFVNTQNNSLYIEFDRPISLKRGKVSPSYGVEAENTVIEWLFDHCTTFELSMFNDKPGRKL